MADSKGDIISPNIPLDEYVATLAADLVSANKKLQVAYPNQKLVFQEVTLQVQTQGEIDGHTGDLNRLLTGGGANATPTTITFRIASA